MRKVALAVGVVVAALATAAAVVLWPQAPVDHPPALAPTPPLPAITRTSTMVAPVAIALPAIRDAVEASTPRDFAGKRDTPISQLLSNAQIGWTIQRGPVAVAGRAQALAITLPLTGTLHATGQLGNQMGNIGGAIGSLLGAHIGQQVQNLAGKAFDERADIAGNVVVTARPALTPNWRLAPNLTAQVNLSNSTLSLGGIPISVPGEVKPFVDRSVGEQLAAVEARLRADPFLEQAVRREWSKLCRTVALGTADAGLPNLWLEVRPTRAYAAQPSVEADAVRLVMGVQAETRVLPAETKPDCPFPAQLDLVPPSKEGRVNLAVPLDIPFQDLDRLLAAQLVGRKFPEDGSGSVEVTVKSAVLAASGDRLLVTLRVHVRQKRFFSFGADAVVHVWGRPVLDQEHQLLRLGDLTLDVESEAAFGLLGAAAKAAQPHLQQMLAERAVVDLKPLAADARKRLAVVLAGFGRQESGLRVDAAVTDLRLTGIGFDAKSLRVIAEADGTVAATVTSLTGP